MKETKTHQWSSPDLILVATNLHDGPYLVPHAIAQARLSAAKVLLAYVLEPEYLRTSPTEGAPFVLPGPTLHAAQDKLNQFVKEFQANGIVCEPLVLKGRPQEQISTLVNERGVDRVIVGTRAAQALERLLLGSVAEDLLHSLDIPVCVIGPHVSPLVRQEGVPASILFATSFHHPAHQSAQLALELANLYQSRLVLLHVIPAGQAANAELHQQREDELASLAKGESELWCDLEKVVRDGDPAAEILAEAKALPADLIVLGATGASKTARLVSAGVVHRIIAEATVPVMTLR